MLTRESNIKTRQNDQPLEESRLFKIRDALPECLLELLPCSLSV